MTTKTLSLFGGLLVAAAALGVEARPAKADFYLSIGAGSGHYGRSYCAPRRTYVRRSYTYRSPYRSRYHSGTYGGRSHCVSPRAYRSFGHYGRSGYSTRYRSRTYVSPYRSHGRSFGHVRGFSGPRFRRCR